jgi:hypothetical protein
MVQDLATALADAFVEVISDARQSLGYEPTLAWSLLPDRK